MITYKRLKEALRYYPNTGNWVWKINAAKNVKIGDVAGAINNHGYRVIKIDGMTYLSSRLAWFYMKGYFPENEVDHEDRNKLNDKWLNLREMSHSCNCRNRNIFKNNKSGITGVRRQGKKWAAYIGDAGKSIYLGTFEKFYDAVKTRWKAEVKYGYPDCNSSSLSYQYLNMKRIRYEAI